MPASSRRLPWRGRRFGRAVRLEVAQTMSEGVLDLLTRELDLDATEVYTTAAPLDATDLFQIVVLPGDAQAALRADRPGCHRRSRARERVLERDHAGVHEQERRVVGRDQRTGNHTGRGYGL